MCLRPGRFPDLGIAGADSTPAREMPAKPERPGGRRTIA